ncbi:DNA-binding MarR family transcriptional regulator [Peptoniphilus olsenii]|uniref:DNA-binding MarR family transcriptional regulator n=1 Tax=Peptoniphilus olsenii TaxID=411570 RepID=A0ABV2JA31_9FIRM
MNKDVYYTEIIDKWIDKNMEDDEASKKFDKLNKIMIPIYNFILAYSNYFNKRRDYGKGPKMTMIEIHILTQISDNPGITVTELAKIWNITTSAISQTVRKLIKQELIYRKNSTTDGKVFHLFTTALGKEVSISHKKCDNVDIVKTNKKLLEKFSVDDLIKFNEICEFYYNILYNSDNE